MKQQKHKKPLPQFATFNAVYCSGFFIDNGALVTTMSLVFDKIWLLNLLELVIDFSKNFRINLQNYESGIKIEPQSPDAEGKDPLAELTPIQRQTAERYLYLAMQFCLKYSPLLREHILCTDLYPDGEIFDVKLVKKGPSGGKNTYNLSQKSMIVATGEDVVDKLDELVSRRAVPLLGGKFGKLDSSTSKLRPKYLSSLLAMKDVELTLPGMRSAHPEIILEARERLSDLLPPFWGIMLRLSTDFSKHLKEGQSLHDLERACEDYIDTNVRPALIELNSKLEKDRKSWFHKILSLTAKETKLIIGKPPLTIADLVSSGLQLGANVALDLAQNETISQEAGLTYLIELDKLIRKST